MSWVRKRTAKVYSHHGKDINQAFSRTYTDYPPWSGPKFPTTVFLDGVQNSAVKEAGGAVVTQRDFTFNGHSARSLAVSIPRKGQTATLRLDLVGLRLYQTTIVGPEDRDLTRERTRFFSRFSLN